MTSTARPRPLLDSARALLASRDATPVPAWPRATALLARQALEAAIARLWLRWAWGTEEASMRVQLICLIQYLNDPELARRAAWAWAALSRACHVHAYELAPGAAELEEWVEAVAEVVEFEERL